MNYNDNVTNEINENIKMDNAIFKITWAINQNWLDISFAMKSVSRAIENNSKIIENNSKSNDRLTLIWLILTLFMLIIWYSQVIISIYNIDKWFNLLESLIYGYFIIVWVFSLLIITFLYYFKNK